MNTPHRFRAGYFLGVALIVVLAGCGGGGGGGGDNGPSVDLGAANRQAPLATREDLAQAAVAVQQLIPDIAGSFDLSDFTDDMGGSNAETTGGQQNGSDTEECDRSGAFTGTQTGDSSFRISFDNCRESNGDGTDTLFNGVVGVTCNPLTPAGDCQNPTLDFSAGDSAATFQDFPSSDATDPQDKFDVIGTLSTTQDGQNQTITSNVKISGTVFGDPDMPLRLLTDNLVIQRRTGFSPAQLLINGTLGLDTGADNTNNCLRGRIGITTEAFATADNDNFDNGFNGGMLQFNGLSVAGGQATASATYNDDGSINVSNDNIGGQTVTADDVATFCTFTLPL